MPVDEVTDDEGWDTAMKMNGLVVVDFFAEWCGPCMRIAPFVEELSDKYADDVTFVKVNEGKAQKIMQTNGITAFPTFRFYKGGKMVDELKGANKEKLEATILAHIEKGQKKRINGLHDPSSVGHKLGGESWDGVGAPPDIAAARLLRLNKFTPPPPAPTPVPPPAGLASAILAADADEPTPWRKLADTVEEVPPPLSAEALEEQNAADDAEALAEVNAEMEMWDGEEMVPLPVPAELLSQLLEFGYSDARARKGIHHGGTVEGACQWIDEHQGDPDIDQPYMVRKKDTIPKKEYTAEEKAAMLEATKQKIVERRKQKEKEEKARNIKMEIERRERGKSTAQTQAERDVLQRKREMEKIKREKKEAAAEREKIKAQIAADKEIRRRHGGVLPSVLGVDGYNPSIANYKDKSDLGASAAAVATSTATATSPSADTAPAPESRPVRTGKPVPVADSAADDDARTPIERINASIERISRYRVGGDGGQAFKLLNLFISNVVTNPSESKYKTINAESKAFKTKLSILGPVTLLKACGFVKCLDGDAEKYVCPDDVDMGLLKEAVDLLSKAETEYKRRNPT